MSTNIGKGFPYFSVIDKTRLTLILLVVFSFIIRVLLFPLQGYRIDLNTFSAWFYVAAEGGVLDFYENVWCDYPPFNVIVFWIFGSLAKHLSLYGAPAIVYMIKLPPTLFDLAISYLIFLFLRGRLGERHALIAAAVYAFNPGTMYNTAVWGQFDPIYTFFIALSLYFISEKRLELSALTFSLAALSKPQALAFLPVIIYAVIKDFNLRRVALSTISFLSTSMIFILPFGWGDPINFILRLYLGGYGEYPFTSLNAFNLWGFIGFMRDTQTVIHPLNYHLIGSIIFGVSLIPVLHHFNYESSGLQGALVYSSFMIFLSFFMFLTRIHERYLFPTIALSLLSIPYSKRLIYVFAFLVSTFTINQAYALYFLNKNMFIPQGDPVAYIISALNLMVTFYCFYLLITKRWWRGG